MENSQWQQKNTNNIVVNIMNTTTAQWILWTQPHNSKYYEHNHNIVNFMNTTTTQKNVMNTDHSEYYEHLHTTKNIQNTTAPQW